MAFKKLRSVTRNLVKMENNREYYFKVQSAMYLGKQIDDAREPATLMNVIDLETGEEGCIIVAAVLRGILQENYPDESYVGKCFEVVKFRDAGSKYNTFNVAEVADPSDEAEIPAAEAETPPATAKKSGKK